MRNNPKEANDLGFLVKDEYELEAESSSYGISLFIKHDHYSSDNKHGRDLLRELFDSLITANKHIDSIYLIDTGTKLLCPDNVLSGKFKDLVCSGKTDAVYVCTESCSLFGISIPSDMIGISASEMFQTLVWLKDSGAYLLTVE